MDNENNIAKHNEKSQIAESNGDSQSSASRLREEVDFGKESLNQLRKADSTVNMDINPADREPMLPRKVERSHPGDEGYYRIPEPEPRGIVGICEPYKRHPIEASKQNEKKDGVETLPTGDSLVREDGKQSLFLKNGDHITINPDGSYSLKGEIQSAEHQKDGSSTVTFKDGTKVSFDKDGFKNLYGKNGNYEFRQNQDCIDIPSLRPRYKGFEPEPWML